MRSLVMVFFLSGILLATISCQGQASTIRDDKTWDDYASLAEDYTSTVGLIYEYTDSGTAIGSGTILSSSSSGSWVLTAAHVVQDATSLTFTINDTTYTADSWSYYSYVTSEDLASAGVGDLALIYISDSIEDAVPATLYTGTTEDLIGSVATYAGYGCTGYGSTGYTSNSYGTLHAVQNTLDTTAAEEWGTDCSDSVMLCDFDSPYSHSFPMTTMSTTSFSTPFLIDDLLSTNASDLAVTASNSPTLEATTAPGDTNLGDSDPIELEGLIAPGDSGGGVFVTIDETMYLVGVNSFVSYTDGTSNADYGDIAGCVSVCDFADWIEDVADLSLAMIPGDANQDGVVDGNDVSILANYWQYGVGMEDPDANWSMGDFNGDGVVDGSDVTILASYWQCDASGSASMLSNMLSVPEPSIWCLLVGLLIVVAGRKRLKLRQP